MGDAGDVWLLGTVMLVCGATTAASLAAARGARVRADALEHALTQRAPGTTKCSASERHPGGRPDREGVAMAAIGDDLRLGAADMMRRDTRSVVAYATGAALIAAGILFRDHMPYKGAVVAAIGGVIVVAAIFLPPIANKAINRVRPADITAELADLERAMIAGQAARFAEMDRKFAAQVNEMRRHVADIRTQLR